MFPPHPTQRGDPMSTPMYDLPEHCPVLVNERGEGPADEVDAVAEVCWCEQGRHCPVIPFRQLP